MASPFSFRTPLLRLLLSGLGFVPGASLLAANPDPAPAALITPVWLTNHLAAAHPRLFWPRQPDAALRAEIKADPVRAALLTRLIRDADKLLTTEPLIYKKKGIRLLEVSREALRRVLVLASVARLTGDDKYVARTEQELLTLAEFEDWDPSHFLDVAEMTAAMAVGYDWLYDRISPGTRAVLRSAMVDKGFEASFVSTEGWQGWVNGKNNWTQVCHGGLSLAALALAERHPGASARVLARAIANVPRPMSTYEPDGAYPEGPGYWGYGTSYNVLLLAALQSALGTDFGLTSPPGFRRTVEYLDQMTGPSGDFFNYSDNKPPRDAQAAVFWLARLTTNTAAFQRERDRLEQELKQNAGLDRLCPLMLFWAAPLAGGKTSPLPLGWLGRGEMPVAVHRSAWNDPLATWTALKGGSPSGPHAHMDSGSFVLEADGVRWAEDLGAPDYNRVESAGVALWNTKPGSPRWNVLEISAATHNMLTFGNEPMDVTQTAPLVRFAPGPQGAHVVVDTSPVNQNQARKTLRGLAWQPDGRILLQDDLEGVAAGTPVRWAMLTQANITIKGRQAVLQKDGKRLTVDFLEPNGLVLGEVSLETVEGPGNVPRPGYRLLTATVKSPGPSLFRIAAVFTPGRVTKPLTSIRLTSPADWSKPLNP